LGTTTLYNEQELTALLKNKDQAAFARLYDSYSGAIYSIILQIVSDQELANDILQEVFINIWRKIEMYDAEKGRLFTWMLNIARNASIDMLRSRSYRNSQKNQSIQENVDVTVPGNTEQMNIDSIGLKKLLEKLKPEQRVLIDLSYFKGYTHEEIAEQEKIPLGTVKTRIRNALIQLREILK
jgi:RNA polymerase sigma-70 factor (ECF subfamily)